jgi:hypothetical protein
MVDRTSGPERNDELLPRPIGTLFVMTVYLAILAGMWAVMLSVLIHR